MIRRVAIIGAGRFAEVMLDVMTTPEERGSGIEVVASHRRPERRAELQQRYNITVYADNREACHDADVVYTLVRPDQMASLMKEIGPVITDDQVLAAGAATLPMSFYRPFLASKCTLSWVFPTPFMRQKSGFLALCPEPGSNPDRIRDLEAYWGSLLRADNHHRRAGHGHLRPAPRRGSHIPLADYEGVRGIRSSQWLSHGKRPRQ